MDIKNFDFIPLYAQDYLYYLKNVRALSDKTVYEYYLDLRIFFRFVADLKNITDNKDFNSIDASCVPSEVLEKITLSELYIYLNFLNDGRDDTVKTRSRKISSLKSFYKYLCKQAIINENPTLYLDSPKSRKTLPVYLSYDECIKLLDSVDGS